MSRPQLGGEQIASSVRKPEVDNDGIDTGCVEVRTRAEYPGRLGRVARLHDAKAGIFERVDGEHANQYFILDDEDSHGTGHC
jgi:hypothetical protein